MCVRSSIPFYGNFNLDMDRSPGFGSTACNFRPFRLDFSTAPVLQHLNLAAYHNSLARSTKSTRSLALPLLVSIRFQVLFHSPPGVLFTFPSRYYSLSVTGYYLGLGGGPPGFKPNSTCSVLLWCHIGDTCFSHTGILPSVSQTFQLSSAKLVSTTAVIHNPVSKLTVWPLSLSLAAT